MVEAICIELSIRKDYLKGIPVDTIYFGGGTPSLLNEFQLSKIFDQLNRLFPGKNQEITLEANPDDLIEPKLRFWKKVGIDRLSLGVQSFQEEVLTFYNRAHTATEAKQAIEKARQAGFSKFSLDLIYGFPWVDHSLWHSDLQQAIELDPGHISAYSLTIEPKTALGNWMKKGKFQPAEEDFVADQFEWMQSQLEMAGYVQYEVSNFGKPGQLGLHNSNYWKGKPYLGVGPSAHSFNGKSRGFNPSSNSSYLKAIQSDQIPFIIEDLDPIDALNEKILTGLRTSWGIQVEELQKSVGIDIIALHFEKIDLFRKKGWVKWDGKTLSLTRSGFLLADSIAAELFV